MVSAPSRALLLAGIAILAAATVPTPAQAAPDGTAIASGLYHNCVLKASRDVYCWGSLSTGYLGGDAIALSAGYSHACVLKLDKSVHCWGIGAGAQDYLDHDAKQVAAGQDNTCVLRDNGNVHCYGDDIAGETSDYVAGPGSKAIFVATGHAMTCIVKEDNTPHCWGYNNLDWYTDGNLETIVIAHNGYVCLGKLDKSMDCGWGRLTAPQAIKAAVGINHFCILTTAHNVECELEDIGLEDHGQAADYHGGDAIDVSAGYYSTCILKATGNVDCQGSNGGYGDYGVPAAPTGLTVTQGGTGELVVSWDAVARTYPTVSYNVYRGTASGLEVLVTSGGCGSPRTTTTCTDSGLGNGATRYYRVSAANSLGEGPQSAEASGTTAVLPASAPREFKYDLVSDQLSWREPTDTGGSAIARYNVSVRVATLHPLGYCPVAAPPAVCSETGEAQVTAGGCANLGNVLSCTPSDCPATRHCYYRVSAVTASNAEGAKTDEVEVLGAR